jgi:CBS domain-containing protein
VPNPVFFFDPAGIPCHFSLPTYTGPWEGFAMKCKDIMTSNPRVCSDGVPVVDAAKIMKEEDVGVVPVVDEKSRKKLIGIITDRDICLHVAAEDKLPSAVLIRDCMSSNPVTCTPEEDLQKAMDLMEEHQVRRIPIVERDGTLVGIISLADVATSSASSGDKAEVIQEVSKN